MPSAIDVRDGFVQSVGDADKAVPGAPVSAAASTILFTRFGDSARHEHHPHRPSALSRLSAILADFPRSRDRRGGAQPDYRACFGQIFAARPNRPGSMRRPSTGVMGIRHARSRGCWNFSIAQAGIPDPDLGLYCRARPMRRRVEDGRRMMHRQSARTRRGRRAFRRPGETVVAGPIWGRVGNRITGAKNMGKRPLARITFRTCPAKAAGRASFAAETRLDFAHHPEWRRTRFRSARLLGRRVRPDPVHPLDLPARRRRYDRRTGPAATSSIQWLNALGSTAAYPLRAHAWQIGAALGLRGANCPAVSMLPLQAATRTRTSIFWRQRGRAHDGWARNLPGSGVRAVLLPAGIEGPAFLVSRNFDAIYSYNQAESYALAIALLADRIAGLPGIQAPWPTDDPPLFARRAARSAGAA